MRKLGRRLLLCLLGVMCIGLGSVLADRDRLSRELIRLHVVANSDSSEDQAVKLQIRDAVLNSLENAMAEITDMEDAKEYLESNLPKLQRVANETLQMLGCDCEAMVSLCRESFDRRDYDTFSLPAGIYESLRIVIGEGQGHNWWCVVFPSFCLPAASEEFAHTAAGAGFPAGLNSTLAGEEPYEIRFFLLDALGRAETLLFGE